jgi:hypothetical protein
MVKVFRIKGFLPQRIVTVTSWLRLRGIRWGGGGPGSFLASSTWPACRANLVNI